MDNQENKNPNNNNPSRPPQKPVQKKRTWLWALITVLLIVMIIYIVGLGNKIEKISYTEFQDKVIAGEVVEVYTSGNNGYVLIKDSKIKEEKFPDKADFKLLMTITMVNLTDKLKHQKLKSKFPTQYHKNHGSLNCYLFFHCSLW